MALLSIGYHMQIVQNYCELVNQWYSDWQRMFINSQFVVEQMAWWAFVFIMVYIDNLTCVDKSKRKMLVRKKFRRILDLFDFEQAIESFKKSVAHHCGLINRKRNHPHPQSAHIFTVQVNLELIWVKQTPFINHFHISSNFKYAIIYTI